VFLPLGEQFVVWRIFTLACGYQPGRPMSGHAPACPRWFHIRVPFPCPSVCVTFHAHAPVPPSYLNRLLSRPMSIHLPGAAGCSLGASTSQQGDATRWSGASSRRFRVPGSLELGHVVHEVFFGPPLEMFVTRLAG